MIYELGAIELQRTLVEIKFTHKNFEILFFFLSQIESSSTKKYCFLYVNKSYEVLGRSTSFHINHIDPRGDLDLIDLEDFAFVNSSPDQEQGEYRATKIY